MKDTDDGKGAPMRALMRVYSAIDESVLLSMLDSADIEAVPSASNYQRAQYGSMYTLDTGVIVAVNEADLEEARAIAADFLETRKRDASGGLLPEVLA